MGDWTRCDASCSGQRTRSVRCKLGTVLVSIANIFVLLYILQIRPKVLFMVRSQMSNPPPLSLARVPVSAYSHKSGEYNIMFDTSLGLCLVMTAAVWIVPFWTYIYPTAPVGTASQHKKNLFYCNFAKMIYKSRRKMVLFCLHPEWKLVRSWQNVCVEL